MNRIYFVIFILLASCQSDENNNNLGIERFKLSIPSYFPDYTKNEYNPLTKQGVELGKKLFFDRRLSSNNNISCASCHVPTLNFSDGQALSSLGVSGEQLKRTSPVLVNLLWNDNGFFWDGGSKNLESQAIGPITNHDEMGQDLEELVLELEKDVSYVKSFKDAFNDEITVSNIMKALAQFQRTLISSNSKYDKIRKNDPNITFTKEEQQGYKLFKKHCNSCHTEPLFTDNSFHNNGLDSLFEDSSFDNLYKGRYRVTHVDADIGKYRTPTLRNIIQSAPYMHDGRLKSIEEVLNHYCCNVKNSTTLDQKLKSNDRLGFLLSEEDKSNMIKFLRTLTDEDFLTKND